MLRTRIRIVAVCTCVVFTVVLGSGWPVSAAPSVSLASRQASDLVQIHIRASRHAAYRALQTLTDWPQFGFDSTNTRYNPNETTLSVTVVSGGLNKLSWSPLTLTPAGNGTAPIVLGSTLYYEAGSFTEQVDAINPSSSGTQIWTNPPLTGGGIAGLAGGAGSLYVVDSDDWGYRINATSGAVTGQRLFTSPTDNCRSQPVIANGVVYVGLGNYLYALSTTTGQNVWPPVLTGGCVANPAVANGVVYVASTDSRIYAINASTGAMQWNKIVPGGINGNDTVVAGNLIYVQVHNTIDTNNIDALSTTDGSVVWTEPASFSPPAVANGVVYVGVDSGPPSYNTYLAAYDAMTGATKWTSTPTNGGPGTPAVADGVVYAVTSSGINAWTTSACSQPPCGTIWSASLDNTGGIPIVVNGMLFIMTDSNNAPVDELWGFGM